MSQGKDYRGTNVAGLFHSRGSRTAPITLGDYAWITLALTTAHSEKIHLAVYRSEGEINCNGGLGNELQRPNPVCPRPAEVTGREADLTSGTLSWDRNCHASSDLQRIELSGEVAPDWNHATANAGGTGSARGRAHNSIGLLSPGFKALRVGAEIEAAIPRWPIE